MVHWIQSAVGIGSIKKDKLSITNKKKNCIATGQFLKGKYIQNK